MKHFVYRLKRFCGYLTGFVFFSSGILKLMDPVGTSLIVREYLQFFHMEFLSFAAMPAAVSLALLESVSGAMLITGVWRKVSAAIVLSMMCFFTPLTLILLIFNPAMDCGCFGEALHLTHLQTFLKNVVLLLLCVISFFPFSALGKPSGKKKYLSFFIVSFSLAVFGVYSALMIPLVDFTDYAASARLEASDFSASHGTSGDSAYQAVFVYEKDGERREFTLDDLPDSTWTYISTETRTLDEKTDDEVLSLPVIDASGTYHDVLATGEKVMVVSIYAPEKAGLRKWRTVSDFSREASAAGYDVLVLLAASPGSYREIVGKFEKKSGPADIAALEYLEGNVYYSDYKALVSLNRSNGGVTAFSRGFLLKKWAWLSLPDEDDLEILKNEDPAETMLAYDTGGNIVFQSTVLLLLAVMLLV